MSKITGFCLAAFLARGMGLQALEAQESPTLEGLQDSDNLDQLYDNSDPTRPPLEVGEEDFAEGDYSTDEEITQEVEEEARLAAADTDAIDSDRDRQPSLTGPSTSNNPDKDESGKWYKSKWLWAGGGAAIGGVAGFFIGGPIGALLGALIGGAVGYFANSWIL